MSQALGRTSFSELPRLRSLALRSLPLEVMETDTLQPLRLLRVFEAEAWTGLGPQGLGKVLASAPSLKVRCDAESTSLFSQFHSVTYKSLCLRDYSPQCNHALHTRCCRRIRGSTG